MRICNDNAFTYISKFFRVNVETGEPIIKKIDTYYDIMRYRSKTSFKEYYYYYIPPLLVNFMILLIYLNVSCKENKID
jgi:hypothetical protein